MIAARVTLRPKESDVSEANGKLQIIKCDLTDPVANSKIRWMAGSKGASIPSVVRALVLKAITDLEAKRGHPFPEEKISVRKLEITSAEQLL